MESTSGDDTSVGVGPVEETGIVSNEVRAGELAWSLADDSPTFSEQPWRRAFVRASALLCFGVALAAAIWVGLREDQNGSRARSEESVSVGTRGVPDTAAEIGVAPPIAIADSPMGEHETELPAAVSTTADDVYVGRLAAAGIVIYDRAGVISNGHVLCTALSQGMTDSQIVPALVKKIPSFTVANAEGMLDAAVVAYCPQFSGKLGSY